MTQILTETDFPCLIIFSNFLKCLDDDEELSTYGDFNTNVAANLMIVFEKCDESVSTCKSKE